MKIPVIKQIFFQVPFIVFFWGILQSNRVCTALSPDFILHSYFDMKLAKSCLMIKCRDFVCVLRPRKVTSHQAYLKAWLA